MRKRLWLTLPLCLIAGAAFAAVSVGSAAGGTRHASTVLSTLHVTADNTDVDHSDPALAYGVLSWQTEYETCTTLLGYKDSSGSVSNSIAPMGAVGMPVVTNGGKTYTFTIKSGMHFSNGDPITGKNYEYAFDRDALHNLASPVSAFMQPVKGWAAEENSLSESIKSVSGISSTATKLTINLSVKDGTLLAVLALPFFCPLDKAAPFWNGSVWKDSQVSGAWPGSGPYYLFSRNPTVQEVLKTNTHYSGTQKHVASQIVIDMNTSAATAYNGIGNNTYASDLNGNPEPANNHALFNTYGLNNSHFWVYKELAVAYLAMNQARSAFAKAKVGARKAVNNVIDRPGILAISGFDSGSAQTQPLPKALAGTHWQSNYAYPITTPNTARFNAAKTQSNNCSGHAHINFWHGHSPTALQAASLDSYDLQQMGCVVNSVPFSGYDRYTAAGIKGNTMDIMTAGWVDDYPDGWDWYGILFNGRTIGDTNNNDLAYMENSIINSKADFCNNQVGSTRTNCWGQLDQYNTLNVAPWATTVATNFVDYTAPKSAGYKFDAPFGSVDLGQFYQHT